MSCGPIARSMLSSSMLHLVMHSPPDSFGVMCEVSSVIGTTCGSSSYQMSDPAAGSKATSVPSGDTANVGHRPSLKHSIGGSSGRTTHSADESTGVVDGRVEGGAAGTSILPSSPSETTSTPTTSTTA